ncbi:MAG: TRAP transporter small permease subunit [Reyranella sp.]|uniref:TRAP transporter small permease subunit n=1 Tax=Reyranella sp. TaxID=1929291 RepID=UPI0027316EC3|nr:TRAP transporter small permease subunit [Reyranella sp.]MDP1961075.1 TRAP transporter small permease subunit [Reyranella sp.]MDP2378785.1 TRAP transporter small permease subunit [Reyranella sp.]
MRPLLALSERIDRMNERVGWIADLMVLLACLVSAANAMIRYAFDDSSNAWLELQWYMFAVVVMLGVSYTLKRNEHVRVDLLYMNMSDRQRLWLDLVGGLVFLLPTCALLGWLSWPFFMQSWSVDEGSSNAGGLLRWPVKFLVPLGFALLALQGVSEIIKRIAALRGYIQIDARYVRPEQ